MAKNLPAELLTRISEITEKRARTLLDGLVEHGSMSTDDLKAKGYNHAPRAARDVRELGIKLKTTMVKNSAGGRMASYSFADRLGEAAQKGRDQFPKKLKDRLISEAKGQCQICGAYHNLQVDHRIPFEVAGEDQSKGDNPFQILCGSCNRTKSWACEHCENIKLKNSSACSRCYWANQLDYDHIAMREERRIDVVWTGAEIVEFATLRIRAEQNGRTVAEELKALLR